MKVNNAKLVSVEAPTTPSDASFNSEIQEWKRRLNNLTTQLKAIDEKAKTRAQPNREATMR